MPATAIRTAIVIETLPRGRWLAWPFADPELAQLGGPDEDPLLIMQLALPEHLTTLTGADIARYATPQGTHLGRNISRRRFTASGHTYAAPPDARSNSAGVAAIVKAIPVVAPVTTAVFAAPNRPRLPTWLATTAPLLTTN